MKKIPLIILIAFIIWCMICSYFYVVKIKGFPLSKSPKATIIIPQVVKNIIAPKDSNLQITIHFFKNNIKPESIEITDSLINIAYNFQNKSGKTLYIEGYANAETNENNNYKLGRIRAWVIKRMLLEKGINTEFLVTSAQTNSENNLVEISSNKK